MNIVVHNIHIPWNMDALSVNQSITMQDIIDNPQFNWNYYLVSHNRNFDINMYHSQPDKNYDHHKVAWLPTITPRELLINEKCAKYAGLTKVEDLEMSNIVKNGLYGFF
jgi:hypothetical protein